MAGVSLGVKRGHDYEQVHEADASPQPWSSASHPPLAGTPSQTLSSSYASLRPSFCPGMCPSRCPRVWLAWFGAALLLGLLVFLVWLGVGGGNKADLCLELHSLVGGMDLSIMAINHTNTTSPEGLERYLGAGLAAYLQLILSWNETSLCPLPPSALSIRTRTLLGQAHGRLQGETETDPICNRSTAGDKQWLFRTLQSRFNTWGVDVRGKLQEEGEKLLALLGGGDAGRSLTQILQGMVLAKCAEVHWLESAARSVAGSEGGDGCVRSTLILAVKQAFSGWDYPSRQSTADQAAQVRAPPSTLGKPAVAIAGIMAFSFGMGDLVWCPLNQTCEEGSDPWLGPGNVLPGNTNTGLAVMVLRLLQALGTRANSTPIYVQWEIGDVLTGFHYGQGTEHEVEQGPLLYAGLSLEGLAGSSWPSTLVKVFPNTGEYLNTAGVFHRFLEAGAGAVNTHSTVDRLSTRHDTTDLGYIKGNLYDQAGEARIPMAVVAHPDHSPRCGAIVSDSERPEGYEDRLMESVIPSSDYYPSWTAIGCDPYGYDHNSSQSWTGSRAMFVLGEVATRWNYIVADTYGPLAAFCST